MAKRKLLVMLAIGATVALCGCSTSSSTSTTTASDSASTTTAGDSSETTASDSSDDTSSSDDSSTEATTEAPNFEEEYNYSDYITLGNYKGIEYEEQDTEVTDKEVEENIQSTLEAAAEVEEDKTKKTVADGDIVNIDYTGKVDGKEFDGGSAEGYDLEIGSDSFIDDFEDQLIGQKVGAKKTVKVTFPDDYSDEDLAGKDAEFDVTINYIGKEVVPELTDEYVKENLEADSVKDYKKTVRQELEESKKSTAESTIQNTVWTQVVENAKKKKDFPEAMLTYQKEQLESNYSSYAEMYGMEVDEFLESMTGMTLDECAEDSVKRTMVASLIIDKEKLTLSDSEYKEKLESLAKEYSYDSGEEFEEANGKDVIEEYLLNEKLLEYLVEQGKETKATTTAATETTTASTTAKDSGSTTTATTAKDSASTTAATTAKANE